METSGVIGSSAIALIKYVGHGIADCEDNSNATFTFYREFLLTSFKETISLSLDLARKANSHEIC